MIDVIVSGGLNLTVEDTGDIINVTVEVAAPIAVEVVVGVPTKEGIVGLSKDDSPEFADVVIPDIAEESSYTASAWAWLTGLFGTVTGSVKAMLVGLVERMAIIEERVGELEDDVIYEGTIEEDVTSITISVDKNGMPLNLRRMRLFVSGDFTQPSAYQVRINNRTDGIYRNYVLDPLANQIYRNRFYIESTTSFITEKMLVDITIENNEAFVDHRVNAIRPDNAYLASNRGLSYTHGLGSDVITSVTIFSYSTLSQIKAGTKITIKK